MRLAATIVLVAVALAGAARLLVEDTSNPAVAQLAEGVSSHCGTRTTCSGSRSSAQSVVAPSGNAGLNQYLETIPTAAGGRPSSGVQQSLQAAALTAGGTTSGGSGGSGASDGGSVGAGTLRALRALGKNGSATASLAIATLPPVSRNNERGDAQFPPTAGGDSALGAMADTLVGSGAGGVGFLLPFSMCAAAAAAIWVVVLKRRRRREEADDAKRGPV